MLLAAPASAQPAATCDARTVLGAARAASGGEAWNGIAETSASGDALSSGLHGTAAFDVSLRDGRYAQRFRLAVIGLTATVFDGRTTWQQDISGGVHPNDSAFAQSLAATDAYVARRGYFAPGDSTPKSCAVMGTGSSRQFVVHVRPAAGLPADLAFDAGTNLLHTVREVLSTTVAVSTYGDYRTNGALVLPYRLQSGTQAEPADGYDVTVRRYSLRHAINEADFARPVPTNVAHMGGGVSATTVRTRVEGQQLFVWASIDGHAPMPFILDTGGHAILTAGAARTLGLRGSGAGESGGSGAGTVALQYTRAHSIALGGATLLDQPMLIIPYPYSFYERGNRTPLAGILGLEIFEHFTVRIDYGTPAVTLALPSAPRARAGESVVPIRFTDDMPLVRSAADGVSGIFGIDTGNAGALILFGHFLRSGGFVQRYTGGIVAVGQGTGGSNSGTVHTLRRFTIGADTVRDVPAFFTYMTKGSFSSTSEAGNAGFAVLSRFVPTFDYAAQTLSLAPRKGPLRIVRDRSGLQFFKDTPDAFDVVGVRPRTPAARAGIAAGDRIVAVNGAAASAYSRADLFDLVRVPGTTLRLRVDHRGTTRDVVLTLSR
jgi:hypothetical protein